MSSLQGTFIQPYLSPPRAGAVSGLFFWDVHRTGGPRLSASVCYRETEEEYSMPTQHERIHSYPRERACHSVVANAFDDDDTSNYYVTIEVDKINN